MQATTCRCFAVQIVARHWQRHGRIQSCLFFLRGANNENDQQNASDPAQPEPDIVGQDNLAAAHPGKGPAGDGVLESDCPQWISLEAASLLAAAGAAGHELPANVV